jgi:hypothetical protein
MPELPREFTFELNCFLTSEDSKLSDITFKRLELASKQDYGMLRDLLRDTQAIWYALGDKIYLVGDDGELWRRLSNANIEVNNICLVEYSEMLERRELALRAILHSAVAQLMTQNGFRPSISRHRSYYPYFDIKNGVQVTTRMSLAGATVLVKNGLQFALTLSPTGRALIWIDAKLFTFVHFDDESQMKSGEPIYVFCTNPDCPTPSCKILTEGAFLDRSGTEDAFPAISCASSITHPTPVKSKAGNMGVLIPYQWAYTTASTRVLREQGIYDRWRDIAQPSAPNRYRVMYDLVELVADRDESLIVPLPDEQNLIFSLSPIQFTRKMRWS